MLFDPQVGFMVEQAVQHVGRVANSGIDDLRMKRRVLVGEMRIEKNSWLTACLLVRSLVSKCSCHVMLAKRTRLLAAKSSKPVKRTLGKRVFRTARRQGSRPLTTNFVANRQLDVQNWSYTVGSSNPLNWFNLKGINPVLQEMREAVPRVGQDNSRLQRRSLLHAGSIN
jgi:hypothetical protein